jgi:hypothetical protein
MEHDGSLRSLKGSFMRFVAENWRFVRIVHGSYETLAHSPLIAPLLKHHWRGISEEASLKRHLWRGISEEASLKRHLWRGISEEASLTRTFYTCNSLGVCMKTKVRTCLRVAAWRIWVVAQHNECTPTGMPSAFPFGILVTEVLSTLWMFQKYNATYARIPNFPWLQYFESLHAR